MTTEENLNYVAAKEVTGKEREDVLDDLKKEMLEKQNNIYFARVFFIKQHGLETIKNAVCKFIENQFGLKGKAFYDKVHIGGWYEDDGPLEAIIKKMEEPEENCNSNDIKITYDHDRDGKVGKAFLQLSELDKGAILLKTIVNIKENTGGGTYFPTHIFASFSSLIHSDELDELENVFYHDIYNYIEEYLEKIGENRCPSCGEEITGKGKFCSNCGATL